MTVYPARPALFIDGHWLSGEGRAFCAGLDLANFTDPDVFGGDAFERKKPDPLPLLKTCEALGVPPSQTLMVGDSSNDAQAARAAGCEVLLVTYGYNHGHDITEVPALAHVGRLDEVDWARWLRP